MYHHHTVHTVHTDTRSLSEVSLALFLLYVVSLWLNTNFAFDVHPSVQCYGEHMGEYQAGVLLKLKDLPWLQCWIFFKLACKCANPPALALI